MFNVSEIIDVNVSNELQNLYNQLISEESITFEEIIANAVKKSIPFKMRYTEKCREVARNKVVHRSSYFARRD